MFYKFFDKKSKGNGVNIQLEFEEQLAKELHKPIYSVFSSQFIQNSLLWIDNIWGADLAEVQLISKFNKGFRLLLCVIVIFSIYAWVVPLKDKKGASIVDVFQKILDDSDRKPNKIWVDKESEFYNNFFKKQLKDNDIEMCLIYNEGKSVVAEIFIRTLKTKICKYMTSVSKNVYLNKLDDIVAEYNNTYHRTIKMKPVQFKDNIFIYVYIYIYIYILILKKKLMIKIQKLVIMSEFLNTNLFLLKDTHQTSLKKFL